MTHQISLVVRQSVILSSKTSDNVLTPEGVGLMFDLEIKARQLPGYNDTCIKRGGANPGKGTACGLFISFHPLFLSNPPPILPRLHLLLLFVLSFIL